MSQVAAIVGGGVIGGGWAARFALMGWDARIFDPDPEAERRIREVLANARALIARARRRGDARGGGTRLLRIAGRCGQGR